MVLLEQGGGVAFDMKAGGPLELALLPDGGEPETVALRGSDVAVLLDGEGRAGPLRVTEAYDGVADMVWWLTVGDGDDGTTVCLTAREMSMLRSAIRSRLWRMYQ